MKTANLLRSLYAQEDAENVIRHAESARDAQIDIYFAYGAVASPNGTSPVSSQLGKLRPGLIPTYNGLPLGQGLPGNIVDAAPLDTVKDNGVPCMHRNETHIARLPVGVTVVQGAVNFISCLFIG